MPQTDCPPGDEEALVTLKRSPGPLQIGSAVVGPEAMARKVTGS
jgi:hypothetical protein